MRSQYGPLHFVDEETGARTSGSLAKVTELEGRQSWGIQTPAFKAFNHYTFKSDQNSPNPPRNIASVGGLGQVTSLWCVCPGFFISRTNVMPPMRELVQNIQQDIYNKSPL